MTSAHPFTERFLQQQPALRSQHRVPTCCRGHAAAPCPGRAFSRAIASVQRWAEGSEPHCLIPVLKVPFLPLRWGRAPLLSTAKDREKLRPCSSPAAQLTPGRNPAVPPAAVLQSVLRAERSSGEYSPLNMQKVNSGILKSQTYRDQRYS